MTLNTTSSKPYNVLLVSPSPKFHSVSLYEEPFWSYKCTECPIMTLNTTRSNFQHICVTNCRYVRNFNQFCSMDIRFWVSDHFETSVLNDLKMTLNTSRSKVPIYVLLMPLTPKFQSASVFGQPFPSYRSLWEVHRMALKWSWILWGQRYPIYVPLEPPSPKFHSVSLYAQPFLSYVPFWDKCREWPQNAIEHYKIKLPYIGTTRNPESQISITSTVSHFWDTVKCYGKVHRMTQNNIEHFKVKSTLYMFHQYPWGPNFNPFRGKGRRFRVKAHFETSALYDPKITLNTMKAN